MCCTKNERIIRKKVFDNCLLEHIRCSGSLHIEKQRVIIKYISKWWTEKLLWLKIIIIFVEKGKLFCVRVPLSLNLFFLHKKKLELQSEFCRNRIIVIKLISDSLNVIYFCYCITNSPSSFSIPRICFIYTFQSSVTKKMYFVYISLVATKLHYRWRNINSINVHFARCFVVHYQRSTALNDWSKPKKKTSITSHYYGFVRVHYSNVEWWKMPLWINSIDVAHDIYEKRRKRLCVHAKKKTCW